MFRKYFNTEAFHAFIAAQAEYGPAWFAVCAASGIAVFFACDTHPDIYRVIGIAVVLAVMLFRWKFLKTYIVPRLISLAAFAFVIGYAGAAFQFGRTDTILLDKEVKYGKIVGTVENIEKLSRGFRVVLQPQTIEGLEQQQIPQRVRITLLNYKNETGWQGLRGAVIGFKGSLIPPSPPLFPGGYDFRRNARFDGFGGYGYSMGKEIEIIKPGAVTETGETFEPFKSVRMAVSKRVYEVMDKKTAGLAVTLMTGERGGLSDKDYTALKGAGLAHILSISGIHIGMFAGFIFFAARFLMACSMNLALRFPIKKIAALLAIAGALFYTCVEGGSVPAVRSFFMTAFIFLAVMLDRSPFSPRLLAVAAVAVMLMKPDDVVGPGFQMSFAAVTGLICFYDATRGFWKSIWQRAGRNGIISRFGVYLLGAVATTVIATLATSVYAVYHFGQLAPYSLFGNLAADSIMAFFTMPAIVINYALLPLGHGIDVIPLKVIEYSLRAVMAVSYYITDTLPHALVNMPEMPFDAMLWFTCGGILLCLVQGRMRAVGLIPVACGILSYITTPHPDIYIMPKMQYIAVRDDAGNSAYTVLELKRDKFVRDALLTKTGEGATVAKPKELYGNGCDEWGCVFKVKGKTVAVSLARESQAEDCMSADIIISREPVKNQPLCKDKPVVDWWDIYDRGGMKGYVSDTGAFTAEFVNSTPSKKTVIPAQAGIHSELKKH